MGAAAQGLSNVFSAPARALGGLMDGLGKISLAGAGIQALAGAAKGLGDTLGVGLNSEMEQVRASINAFTKDGAQTEEILKKIRTEANSTPFGFREMATATAALMPVAKGAKVDLMALVKEAEVLAASNPMEGLEGASFSLREAMTGDFTSIIERFNLSRTTINKLKAEGVPNLEIVRRAMKEMGFDQDLIAGKAQTLEGRWSTFMDTIDTLRMKIGEPIFDALKDGLVAVQGFFDDNADSINGFVDGVATNIGRIITIGKALFAAFTSDAGAMGIVQQQLREMFGDEFADAIEPFIQFFMGEIPKIKQFAVDAFQAIGAGAQMLMQFLGQAGKAGADALGELVQLIGELLGLSLDDYAFGWDTFVGVLQRLQDIGTQALNDLIQAIAEIFGLEPADYAQGWDMLAGVFQRFADIVEQALAGDVVGAIEEMLAIVVAADAKLTAAFRGWALAFVQWIGPMIPQLLAGLMEINMTIAQWILQVGIDIAAEVVIWGLHFIGWIRKDVLPNLPGALAAIWTALVNWITGTGDQIEGEASSIGVNMLEGIRNGIMSRIGAIAETGAAAVRRIIEAAKEAAGIQSPSVQFAEIGRQLLEGLGIGIRDNTFTAVNSMRGLVDKLSDVVRNAGFGEELIAKMENALVGLDAAIGTAAKQSERVRRLQQEASDAALWRKPEALAFQQRANELEKEQIALEKQMVPLLRFRDQMQREMREAEEALQDARDSGNKRAIKDAELAVAQAKSNLRAAEDALKPYDEQNRLLRQREEDLRREQREWEAVQQTAQLAQEQTITQEQQLQRVFESQADAAKESLNHLEDVTDEFKEQRKAVDRLDDKVGDLGDSLDNLDFDSLLDHFNVRLPGFADGGIVPGRRGQPMLAVVHGGERIIPVGGSGAGGSLSVGAINIYPPSGDAQQIAREVRDELLRFGRRNGYGSGSIFGGLA